MPLRWEGEGHRWEFGGVFISFIIVLRKFIKSFVPFPIEDAKTNMRVFLTFKKTRPQSPVALPSPHNRKIRHRVSGGTMALPVVQGAGCHIVRHRNQCTHKVTLANTTAANGCKRRIFVDLKYMCILASFPALVTHDRLSILSFPRNLIRLYVRLPCGCICVHSLALLCQDVSSPLFVEMSWFMCSPHFRAHTNTQ